MADPPRVLHQQRTGNQVTVEAKIPSDLTVFEDHFPSFAVLPAFVQLEWVGRLAEEHFGRVVTPCEVPGMKFHSMLHPGDRFRLKLTLHPEEEALDFRFSCDGDDVSSGRIRLSTP